LLDLSERFLGGERGGPFSRQFVSPRESELERLGLESMMRLERESVKRVRTPS